MENDRQKEINRIVGNTLAQQVDYICMRQKMDKPIERDQIDALFEYIEAMPDVVDEIAEDEVDDAEEGVREAAFNSGYEVGVDEGHHNAMENLECDERFSRLKSLYEDGVKPEVIEVVRHLMMKILELRLHPSMPIQIDSYHSKHDMTDEMTSLYEEIKHDSDDDVLTNLESDGTLFLMGFDEDESSFDPQKIDFVQMEHIWHDIF